MFKDKRMSALSSFNWKNIVIDLKRTAPILLSVLQNSIQQDVNRDVTMAIAAGVLLQGNSERANLLQCVISLLDASHSPKQSSTRLQRAGLCVSHRSISLELQTSWERTLIVK